MTEAERVRQPAVAGLFYPAERSELAGAVHAYLDLGSALAVGVAEPKAVVAPHAGYDYSGPIAGTAFAALAGLAETVRRVVLLGPSHHVAFSGLALPHAEAFATPLGSVPVDAELAARVRKLPQVSVHPDAHEHEHSLEVELPFLQMLFADFTVLPLVVGEAGPEQVAEALDVVWGGEETKVVVSSDLSHYLPYEDARRADAASARRILALDPSLGPYDACGAYCVNGLVRVAKARGLACELLDLRNSGDTVGDLDRVVGYGAFDFFQP